MRPANRTLRQSARADTARPETPDAERQSAAVANLRQAKAGKVRTVSSSGKRHGETAGKRNESSTVKSTEVGGHCGKDFLEILSTVRLDLLMDDKFWLTIFPPFRVDDFGNPRVLKRNARKKARHYRRSFET